MFKTKRKVNKVFASKENSTWTLEDVGDWLDSIGLGEYKEAFSREKIGGEELLKLTSPELAFFGMSMDARDKLIFHLHGKGDKSDDDDDPSSDNSDVSSSGSAQSTPSSGAVSADMITPPVQRTMSAGALKTSFIRDKDALAKPSPSIATSANKANVVNDLCASSSATEYEDLITVKAHHGRDVKFIRLPTKTNYFDLQSELKSAFQIKSLDKIALKYWDEDKIAKLTTDQDWRDCLDRVGNEIEVYVREEKTSNMSKSTSGHMSKSVPNKQLPTSISSKKSTKRTSGGAAASSSSGGDSAAPVSPVHSTTSDRSEDIVARIFSAFDFLLQGIVIIDEKGVVQYMNDAFTKLSGYAKNELYGKNINRIMTSEDAKKHDAYLRNYIKTGVKHVIGRGRQLVMLTRDRSYLSINLNVTENFSTGTRMFVATMSQAQDELPSARERMKSDLLRSLMHRNAKSTTPTKNSGRSSSPGMMAASTPVKKLARQVDDDDDSSGESDDLVIDFALSKPESPSPASNLIGAGPIGMVYLTSDFKDAAMQHALKIVPVKSDADLTTLIREYIKISLLTHPNILRIIDDPIAASEPIRSISVPLELATEGNLATFLTKSPQSFTAKTKLSMCTNLAGALSYLHHMQLMHRNLKLSNVLIFPGPIAKLSDIGTSMHLSLVANSFFAPPEIVLEEAYVKGSDIFSLGILFLYIISANPNLSDLTPLKKRPASLLNTQPDLYFSFVRSTCGKVHEERFGDTTVSMSQKHPTQRITADHLLNSLTSMK